MSDGDRARVLDLARTLADEGNGQAIRAVVALDHETSREWLRRAADAGNAEAQSTARMMTRERTDS
ncbi:hypothetical protein [Salipiger mucosus]|uniref:Uncharacterized protein n=1 Tax=Salipiger mucosus DSM 16094 TaxID=1123237 RepID=S9SI49_9RHOB|nr:hypothetical protein [Salipiger mucosus]EPX86009.1 hypothetical protein Salmuc_00825 [Salipiger mucosus DSM 16094]